MYYKIYVPLYLLAGSFLTIHRVEPRSRFLQCRLQSPIYHACIYLSTAINSIITLYICNIGITQYMLTWVKSNRFCHTQHIHIQSQTYSMQLHNNKLTEPLKSPLTIKQSTRFSYVTIPLLVMSLIVPFMAKHKTVWFMREL